VAEHRSDYLPLTRMTLIVKKPKFYLPGYSLTSDVLGFIRCGLQYRYQGIGKIPTTRPFQLWFGEFIHGVMEEGYRQYKRSVDAGAPDPPPWNPLRIYRIGLAIEKALRDRKIRPNNRRVREVGYLRAVKAINDLAPCIFPLITEAEIKLSATRSMLPIPPRYNSRKIKSYEISGRVDVITSVQLANPAHASNFLVGYLLDYLEHEEAEGRLDQIPQDFEIIIDYKGARRPAKQRAAVRATDYWSIYDWQVKTYAHMRSRQPGSLPVLLGVVIYLNELLPTWDDLETLRKEIAAGATDVVPKRGSDDWKIIHLRRPARNHPDYRKNRQLSWEFRLRRALRVEPVTENGVAEAVSRFDRYVRQIEISKERERLWGQVIKSWPKNDSDPDTCTACDYLTFCPKHPSSGPRLPGA
jgi:hypothetical protein